MILLPAGNYSSTAEKRHLMKQHIPRLHSFYNERSSIVRHPLDIGLMVDSGAHSWNKVSIQSIGGAGSQADLPDPEKFYEGYLDFIEQHERDRVVYVELDVYGVLPLPYLDEMYRRLMKTGKKIMRVYHPIIDHGSLDALKEWIAEGQTYIGVGNDSRPLFDRIFSLTRDRIKLHGFAMTKKDILSRYPFFSADSTSWKSVQMFGGAWLTDRAVRKEEMKKKKMYQALTVDARFTLADGLRVLLSQQDYFTRLWSMRGITWQNDVL